jgi:hypothetical protein
MQKSNYGCRPVPQNGDGGAPRARGNGEDGVALETGCFRNQRPLSDSFTVMAGHDARVINNMTWHKARWLYSATLEAWQAIARMFANTNFTERSV